MTDNMISKTPDNRDIINGRCLSDDITPEMISLRPAKISEYVGQTETIETINIAVEAARQRRETVDHILLHGPPGLGKTTLAHIIANETGGNLVTTSGPALEKGGDLIGILTHLEEKDILFIDEIHRTPKTVEEFLYPSMEDFAVDFIFDKGVHARSHRFQLKHFTLVGATTRVGLLSAPLRDRFGIFRSLDFYSVAELVQIVQRSARLLNIDIDLHSADKLAERSRGTPRVVNRLLKRVRDFAQVKANGRINPDIVDKALSLEGVDKMGLTPLDRRFLSTVIRYYDGGPVGIEAIAATLQEETDTLVDVVEPFLLKEGLIIRTSSGRKATAAAYAHLDVPHQKSLL